MSENTTPAQPVFVGTPHDWWEAATPITQKEAAERVLGDWYIAVDSRASSGESYRVTVPTSGSNKPRMEVLKRRIANKELTGEEISTTVRRLIHTEEIPPLWAGAPLVIADDSLHNQQRVVWIKSRDRWRQMADGRISANQKLMAQLNPVPAVITEQGDPS